MNYKKLGLKCGLELHFQLDTKRKLFCSCSAALKERSPIAEIVRKLHPVASETGLIDVAAEFEYLRGRIFHYQVFKNETCLVELDEEPIHELNREALHIALQIALLLNCEIPSELHVMRKIVIDGSNTSGHQRTVIVGMNGFLEYRGRKIEIANVCLEEDAAALVKEENDHVYYRLNRLGIPLAEIATGTMEDLSPQEIQDVAYIIGLIAKSTRKIKRGVGTIRQDVNVSIKGGARVEIKGVQELGMIAKVIELEVQRQLSIPKVKEETRAALPDGTTRFTRPLPGAGRLYPETDIEPIPVPDELIQEIKEKLPEPWTKKLARFKRKLRLSDELAKQILRSDYLELFEKIVSTKKVEASLVANTFISTIKDLERREKVSIENLSERHFVELFDALAKKRVVKEAIPEILKYLAAKPEDTISNCIKELNLKPIRTRELKKIVKEIISQPGLTFDRAVGLVMSKVRGRVEAQTVIKLVKKMM